MNEKGSWIDWLLSQPFGKYFVKIDQKYLSNSFNYYGIRQKITNFKLAYEIILGESLAGKDLPIDWPKNAIESAINLYGLLHSRYILTSKGQELMYKKFINDNFEICPRVYCDDIRCLPYGSSDELGLSRVQFFCPNCHEAYSSDDPDIQCLDGAFFGTSWIHPFLQRYKHIVPDDPPEKFVPRLFGFRLYGDGVEDSSSSGSVDDTDEDYQH